MYRFRIVIIIFTIFLGVRCNGQTVKTMESLEDSYQACLDKGINMLDCSKTYFQQMDSMLNLVYKKRRKKMSPSQASNLKIEQLKWLSKRDKYFKEITLGPEEKALGEKDREMVIMDKKADFVRDRVLELIKKL
jgi:uncharacterized protein YecT (DUF1311 family)